MPYLLPHYEYITMIDLRYYQKDVSSLLANYPQKDVLMMYALHNLKQEEITRLSK